MTLSNSRDTITIDPVDFNWIQSGRGWYKDDKEVFQIAPSFWRRYPLLPIICGTTLDPRIKLTAENNDLRRKAINYTIDHSKAYTTPKKDGVYYTGTDLEESFTAICGTSNKKPIKTVFNSFHEAVEYYSRYILSLYYQILEVEEKKTDQTRLMLYRR